jgi:hypothetical protein
VIVDFPEPFGPANINKTGGIMAAIPESSR